MPYIIINDKSSPTHYYCGQGFRREIDTTVEESSAEVFKTAAHATAAMKNYGEQAYLYAHGWRIVPVKTRS